MKKVYNGPLQVNTFGLPKKFDFHAWVKKCHMAGGKTQITKLANSLLVHFFKYHIDIKIPYENLPPLPSLLLLCTHILCTVVVLSVA